MSAPGPLHRAITTVLAAAGLCAAASASAQIYRCEGAAGVRFTDQPCAAPTPPVEVPAPIVVPAGPAADLAGEADARRERQRRARDQADAQWAEAHAARKAAEERVRAGRIAGEVVQGMSAADVRRIHGEPATISTHSGSKGVRQSWSYVLADGRRMQVTFSDGRVSDVRTRKEKK